MCDVVEVLCGGGGPDGLEEKAETAGHETPPYTGPPHPDILLMHACRQFQASRPVKPDTWSEKDVGTIILTAGPVSKATLATCCKEAAERGCLPLLALLASARGPMAPGATAAVMRAACVWGHIPVLEWVAKTHPVAAAAAVHAFGAEWAHTALQCAGIVLRGPVAFRDPGTRLLQTCAWMSAVASKGVHAAPKKDMNVLESCPLGSGSILGVLLECAAYVKAPSVVADPTTGTYVVLCLTSRMWATCVVSVARDTSDDDDDTGGEGPWARAARRPQGPCSVSVKFLQGSRPLVYQFRDVLFHRLQYRREWLPLTALRAGKTGLDDVIGSGAGAVTTHVTWDAAADAAGPQLLTYANCASGNPADVVKALSMAMGTFARVTSPKARSMLAATRAAHDAVPAIRFLCHLLLSRGLDCASAPPTQVLGATHPGATADALQTQVLASWCEANPLPEE